MDDTQKSQQTVLPNTAAAPVQNNLVSDSGQARMTVSNVLQNPSTGSGNTLNTPQAVAQPVSAPVGGKEGGSVPLTKQEWVAPSIPEITPTAEVAPFMEVQSETPQIPQAVAQAGVKLAKEVTPVKTSTVVELDKNFNLQTPNTVLLAIKKAHGSVKESVRWLVELVGLAKKKEEALAKDKPEGGSF